jgi:hypothetical protein
MSVFSRPTLLLLLTLAIHACTIVVQGGTNIQASVPQFLLASVDLIFVATSWICREDSGEPLVDAGVANSQPPLPIGLPHPQLPAAGPVVGIHAGVLVSSPAM